MSDLSNEEAAREVVMLAVVNGFERVGIRARLDSLESEALDAYRTAVRANAKREERATLLASLIEKVEGMLHKDYADITYVRVTDVLTLLRTEAETDV